MPVVGAGRQTRLMPNDQDSCRRESWSSLYENHSYRSLSNFSEM